MREQCEQVIGGHEPTEHLSHLPSTQLALDELLARSAEVVHKVAMKFN